MWNLGFLYYYCVACLFNFGDLMGDFADCEQRIEVADWDILSFTIKEEAAGTSSP